MRQETKTKREDKNQWQKEKRKYYANKQHWIKLLTTLGKQPLYTALYTTALK